MSKLSFGAAIIVVAAACDTSHATNATDAGTPSRDAAAAGPLARSNVDRPDDSPGAYQVHVLYVEPSDRTAPRPLDTDGTLERSVTAFNAWLSSRTAGPKLRFDTYQGALDITYVKLAAPYTEEEIAEGRSTAPKGPAFVRDRLQNILKTTFNDPKKLYLTYWDGLAFGRCGGAAYPPSLPGHFTGQYIGGVFGATYLIAAAPRGVTTLAVYSTSELALPAVPFRATLGAETMTVTAVQPTALVVDTPLASAHAVGEALRSQTTIPDCRSNAFSRDGKQLNYWEYSGAHESLHALGIVSASALDFAPMPVAAGHLAKQNPVGTKDLMYQGTEPWGCPTTPSPDNPSASECELDPQHRNYVHPSAAGAVDLSLSAFLDPPASNASAPPAW